MSRLEDALAAGRFLVTAELLTVDAGGLDAVHERFAPYADYVDATNATDNTSAHAHASPLAVAIALKQLGMEPVMQLTCRDRNRLALQADLVGADKRWCEVSHVTYESVKQKDVHVIGDATIGLPVPKSGNVANNMGKAAALSIVSLLNGQAVPLMPPGNTCYSWVSDREAIAVVNSYKIENNKVVQIEQKLTPAQSVSVAQRAEGWRQSIWADMLS